PCRTRRAAALPDGPRRRRILNPLRPQPPRRAVPLLRRTLEGRWGLGAEEEPIGPADPEARIIGEERTREPSRIHLRRRRDRRAEGGEAASPAAPASSAAPASPPTEPVVPLERRG